MSLSPVIKCAVHGTWHPKAAGCSSCASHRKALELGAKSAARRAELALLPLESPCGFASWSASGAFAVVVLMLTACGAEPVEADTFVPGRFAQIVNGSPDVTDAQVAALGELFVKHAPWLDTLHVVLNVTATRNEALERCEREPMCAAGGEATAAFEMDPGAQQANPQSIWWSAFEISHALCHARFAQAGGDGDPTHQHAECFTDVASRVADDFVAAHGADILASVRR